MVIVAIAVLELPQFLTPWVQSAGGSTARYFTKAGNPDHTIQIRGTLVADHSSDAYAEIEATSTSGTRPEL